MPEHTTCARCRRAFTESVCPAPEEPAVCGYCYAAARFTCAECGILTLRTSFGVRYINGLGRVCGRCVADHGYYYCSECDSFYASQCPDHGNVQVRPFDYKPPPIFFDARTEYWAPDKLYCGVELEIGFPYGRRESSLAPVVELMDHFVYFKSDGSVGNDDYCGVEIVTHPFSFAYFQENRERFTEMLRRLRDADCVSGSEVNAGLHVHTARGAYTDTKHLYRFMRLFYENKAWTLGVSGRRESQLRRWASVDDKLIQVARKVVKKAAGQEDDPNRYCGVNLEGRNTVEVRIFRGTLNQRRFLRSLELVFGAFHFTKEVTRTNRIVPSEFHAWMRSKASEYPAYNAYFEVAAHG